MENIIYPIPPKYFIVNGDIITYGKIESDQCFTSGAANLETFDDEESWTARLLELGIDLVALNNPPEPIYDPSEPISEGI